MVKNAQMYVPKVTTSKDMSRLMAVTLLNQFPETLRRKFQGNLVSGSKTMGKSLHDQTLEYARQGSPHAQEFIRAYGSGKKKSKAFRRGSSQAKAHMARIRSFRGKK